MWYKLLDLHRDVKQYCSSLTIFGLDKHLGDSKVHPDGEPWKKCCNWDNSTFLRDAGCACARGRIGERDTWHGQKGNIPFICVHRKTEDGYFRVCAGWHAWREKFLKSIVET